VPLLDTERLQPRFFERGQIAIRVIVPHIQTSPGRLMTLRRLPLVFDQRKSGLADEKDADVECVAVGRASPELIKSTDLLIVGGPTHIRDMTTDFSRKRQSAGKVRKPKASPARART